MTDYYFFPRCSTEGDPGGITVSKHSSLPEGDFGLTEYNWADRRLRFVDIDNFTADERQDAYSQYRGVRP